MKQFESLRFEADADGQMRKNRALSMLTERGWQIRGETIEQGKFKGGDAVCLGLICLPLAFAAGHAADVVIVNIERESPQDQYTHEHTHTWTGFDDNRVMCTLCEVVVFADEQPRIGGRFVE